MNKEKFHNLYNNPRTLYKFFPISNEYAVKIKKNESFVYMFTPNIPKENWKKDKNTKIVDKWRAIVFEGAIFCTSPIFFNDPFDTDLPKAPEIVPIVKERKEIIGFLNSIFRVKKDEMNRLLYSEDFDCALFTVLESHESDEAVRNEIYNEIKLTTKRYKDEVAIACFSEVNNSKLMWAHYANSYSGFCIEYDFTKSGNVNFQRGIGKVIYSDSRDKGEVIDDNYSYTIKALATKEKSWSYEQEWRYTQLLPYAFWKNKVYPIFFVGNCIKSIYLGCNMPVKYQEEIAQYYKNSTVDVYRMVLKDDCFGFYFVKYEIGNKEL